MQKSFWPEMGSKVGKSREETNDPCYFELKNKQQKKTKTNLSTLK